MDAIEEALSRHEKVALQFSGGKDSLAVLFLMQPYWDRLTVYHLDSGDAMPEIRELIAAASKIVPKLVVVPGRRPPLVAQSTWPSDLVGHANTGFVETGEVRLVDRYSCCYQSLMMPMHERMVADEITLIVRGQKDADEVKPPLRSGDTANGIEFLNPIESWTDEQVMAYLREIGAPVPRFYEHGMTASADCMHCTAWLEHRLPQYLDKFHPEVAKVVRGRLGIIWMSVAPVYAALTETAEGGV